VISQCTADAENTGADVSKNDFIEAFNRGTNAVQHHRMVRAVPVGRRKRHWT